MAPKKNVDPGYGRTAGGGGGGGGGGRNPNPANLPNSAKAIVDSFLRQWGLQSLGNWAWNRYRQLGGGDTAIQQLQLEMTERNEFKARFPAYHDLANSGHAMTIAEMLAYEKTAIGMLRGAGVPQGFYDQPEDIAKFMRGQVSVAELQQRVTAASELAFNAPAETKNQLERLYGVGAGALTAFFLDEKKALPLLQQQYQAGQLAGAAQRTGFGQLDQTEAERVAALGVSEQQAQQGFGDLAGQQGALRPQVGEQAITDAQQIEAVFGGDQMAMQRIKKRTQARQNAFQGGSGFGASQQGVTGLGGKP